MVKIATCHPTVRNALANDDRRYSITWTLHAVLHGRISPGSDNASLIMMEVRASGKGIRDVAFEMEFKALEPEEPDPEVLDIMPSEAWRFGQEPTDPGGPATACGDHVTHQIIGSIRLTDRNQGTRNTASWRTNGDAILRLLNPAVLLRRRSDKRFQALCRVNTTIDNGLSIKRMFGASGRETIVLDPTIRLWPDGWSVAFENLQEFMKDIKKAGQNSAAILMNMDDESRRCLLSLSAPEQQLYYVSGLQETLLPGTKKWILKEAEYKMWLSTDDNPQVLWIHGRPGLGKTMLATFLLQEFRRLPSISGPKKKGIVSYYFFVPGASQGNGVITLLRSVIHQAILQMPDLIKHLLEIYRQPGVGEKVFSDQALLWKVLEQITLDPEVEVAYFVIDGLEQCDEELLNVFKHFKSLPGSTHQKSSSSTSPHRKDKWILVSRDDPAVEAALLGFPDIDLNANSASPMEEYVRVGVGRLGLREAFRDSLQEILIDRANGSFLWLAFALAAVQKDPNMDMETLQERLPKGLSSIFNQTLDDLLRVPDDTAREIMRSVLPVTTISCAPLPLQVLEILSESFKMLRIEKNDLMDKIADACGPLVHIREDVIYLAHLSVKEYLASSAANAKLNYGSLRDLHKSVSVQCLRYICRAFADDKSTDILEYPASYWMEHGRQSSQTPEDLGTIFDSTSFFVKNSEIRKRWLTMYWRHRYGIGETQPTNFTMMHIAAESGYSQLAEVLLNKGYAVDVNVVDGSEKTPLHWAALHGHSDVARALLKAGANMHIRAGNQSSVLQVAIQGGHKAMVQLLLENGVGFEMEIIPEARPDIKQLLLERVQLTRMPKPENRAVDCRFWGTIMDIGQSHAYYSTRVPVDRILAPDVSFDELMANGRPNNIREDERLVRWIHIPENNMEWIEILMTKILETPEAVANLLRPDLWSNRIRSAEKTVYGRCLRPVCADFSRDLPTTAINGSNRTMLVMPYLHWGMNRERLRLKNTIHLIQNGNNSLPDTTSMAYEHQHRHRKLLDMYLSRNHPLHTRRTLDQFYYFSLDDKDMEFRDTHQTVSEYFQKNSKDFQSKENKTGDIEDFPILMVDQLWLWVLGDNTVITSFPHRWDNNERCDSYNMTEIVAAVERRLMTKERPRAMEHRSFLAELIANECSGILFDIAKYRDKWLQVREIYENAIGDVANRESDLFRTFCSSLNKPRNWDTTGGEKERYAIGEEVDLLNKIKDIRDELNMIRTIFQTQKMVLEDSTLFKNLQIMVDKRIRDLEKIDQHASQTQEALKHILDLKQKQANAEEAHFLSVQNIESAKQGQAIMTFTIVTIIFAPLSFLTSFFALQIAEFPKLTIGFVLEIIFPITGFVVMICISLAFFNTLKEWWQKPPGRNRAKGDSEKGHIM